MTSKSSCLGLFGTSCRGVAVLAICAAALFMRTVSAQPTEFPADATTLNAETLKGLAGKKFVGKRADGRSVLMEYGADFGYQVSLLGQAGMLDGKVRLDGDKLCQDMRKTLESSCNDVRLKGNMLFYKRNVNGEVITFVAQ